MNRLLPSLALLLAACSACVVNPCDPGKDVAYCDGNMLWTCPEPGVDQLVPDRWVKTDCAAKEQVCVTAENRGALCAISAEPHPACAGTDVWAVCESATVALSCDHGYATGSRSCRACETGEPSGTDAAGPITCHGGFGATCTSDADCASDLACSDTSRCMAPSSSP